MVYIFTYSIKKESQPMAPSTLAKAGNAHNLAFIKQLSNVLSPIPYVDRVEFALDKMPAALQEFPTSGTRKIRWLHAGGRLLELSFRLSVCWWYWRKKYMLRLAIVHILIGFALLADPNALSENTLFCSADSDLSELLTQAGKLDLENKHRDSVELQQNLLSIRPNCYDVHLSIAITYAALNNVDKYTYHYHRYAQLKRQYDNSRPASARPLSPPQKTGPVIMTAPPKKDKISYWKWLYIYSVLKRK